MPDIGQLHVLEYPPLDIPISPPFGFLEGQKAKRGLNLAARFFLSVRAQSEPAGRLL